MSGEESSTPRVAASNTRDFVVVIRNNRNFTVNLKSLASAFIVQPSAISQITNSIDELVTVTVAEQAINTSGGANNSATIGMTGDNITGSITSTLGGGNDISLDLQSPGGSASVTAGGATNTVTIQQTGGGSGHQATVELLGSSNTVGIQQQGTLGDNIVNIKSAGSGNTFSINQNNR
jgi:hypothetical protein